MSKKHGWDEAKAKAARSIFNLNASRPRKAPEERLAKCKPYTDRFICPVPFCLKQVVRVRNHVRQYHGIKSKDEIDRKVSSASKVEEFQSPKKCDEFASDYETTESEDDDEMKRQLQEWLVGDIFFSF